MQTPRRGEGKISLPLKEHLQLLCPQQGIAEDNMKKMKVIVSLILTAAMVLGIFTITFAEENAGETEQIAVEGAPAAEGTTEVEDTTEGEPAEPGETPDAPAEGDDAQQSEPEAKPMGKYPFLSKIYERGIPTLTTRSFIMIMDTLRTIRYILTGRILTGAPRHFDVTVSEDVISICNAISDQSALDVYELITNLPDLTEPARITAKVFQIDVTAYREKMYEAKDKYYEEGNGTMSNLCWLLGAYMSGIDSAYVYLEPKDDYYAITLDVKYSDGTMEVFHPDIYINPETGECFGPDNRGMMTIGFNCNAYEALVYAPISCWMKDFGFCFEYDLLTYILPVYRYQTRRFKFNYGEKEWMIQIWKGNYLITNGGEVGLYYREPGSKGTFYNVVNEADEMPMSLKIYHGSEILVDEPMQMHWWINGFKLGHRLYNPNSLYMEYSIQMRDEEMVKAFTAAIDANMYHDVTYTVDGLTVNCVWPY